MARKKGSGKSKPPSADEEQLPETAWLEAGRANATIVLDHFDLHMIARAGEGDYTSSQTYVADQAQTDRTGGRPIFLGSKVRRAS